MSRFYWAANNGLFIISYISKPFKQAQTKITMAKTPRVKRPKELGSSMTWKRACRSESISKTSTGVFIYNPKSRILSEHNDQKASSNPNMVLSEEGQLENHVDKQYFSTKLLK